MSFDRPLAPANRKSNKTREVREEALDALRELIAESKSQGPVARARILKEVAIGIAALETSHAQWYLLQRQARTEE